MYMSRDIHTEIQKFWEILKTSNKILLINHIRMDGDAWGSLAWLALVLQGMGKQVQGVNDCPVPQALRFLWNNELIDPELDIKAYNPDIIISLDSSDTGRLWETYITWKEQFHNRPLIVIDHHISNPYFWDINIVDAKASSVCELLTHVLFELKLETYISEKAASFLYTGLQTDSNMYFNTNTRKQTLEAGAKLIELWADFRTPISELYKKKTQNQLKFWSMGLWELQYSHDGKVCACVLSREKLKALGIEKDELGGYFKGFVSELLINVEGVLIAYLIYPLSEQENKVSMRSQEGYDVAGICETFWGGGHKQAAGLQSILSQKELEQELQREIEKIL